MFDRKSATRERHIMPSDIDKTQRRQQQSQMKELLRQEGMDGICNRRGMIRS